MKLEVGEFYLTEDGRIIKIVENGKYQFLDKDDFIYDENGINDESNTNRNLIAHIPKGLHYKIIDIIKDYYTIPMIRDSINNSYKKRSKWQKQ